MSTTARKARKRQQLALRAAGRFKEAAALRPTKPTKIGTPPAQRAFVLGPVFRKLGDLLPRESATHWAGTANTRRSISRAAAFIASGGIKR